jgi:two-component system NarL family sensor kinase
VIRTACRCAQAQAAAADVRRLVYGLRPPALDELGLAGALSAYADQLAGPTGLTVRVDVDGNTADLPAAVEVTAFRIATEALANALRHGAARTATVSLHRNADLQLEVCDDGRGLPAGWRPGVGITSMRERATTLGGSLRIESGTAGGTRVSARLPVSTA